MNKQNMIYMGTCVWTLLSLGGNIAGLCIILNNNAVDNNLVIPISVGMLVGSTGFSGFLGNKIIQSFIHSIKGANEVPENEVMISQNSV